MTWVWINWLLQFNDKVTLPNGFVVKRQIDFALTERDDLFAADGQSLLARDIDFICFDDRHVMLAEGALFDNETNARVPPAEMYEAYARHDLDGPHSCNGYYTGWVGPGLLYEGSYHVPDCGWRNMAKQTLQNRGWFERPCR